MEWYEIVIGIIGWIVGLFFYANYKNSEKQIPLILS